MQKLVFEEAWDRTISDTDRRRIEGIFQEAALANTPIIQFSMLQQAINHKGELLITVIIHNISSEPFFLTDKTMHYKTEERTEAKHTFSLPFAIKGKTSMPWTFIFPKESIYFADHLESGNLEFTKKL